MAGVKNLHHQAHLGVKPPREVVTQPGHLIAVKEDLGVSKISLTLLVAPVLRDVDAEPVVESRTDVALFALRAAVDMVRDVGRTDGTAARGVGGRQDMAGLIDGRGLAVFVLEVAVDGERGRGALPTQRPRSTRARR